MTTITKNWKLEFPRATVPEDWAERIIKFETSDDYTTLEFKTARIHFTVREGDEPHGTDLVHTFMNNINADEDKIIRVFQTFQQGDGITRLYGQVQAVFSFTSVVRRVIAYNKDGTGATCVIELSRK